MPQQCTWIGIHMISDYTHCAKVGNTSASCESEMNTRMNEIDGIYRADIQKGFRVEQLTTHTSSGGPGYNAPGLNINAHLDALSAWKGQNDPNRGVVQCYAGRVTSGAVGLAANLPRFDRDSKYTIPCLPPLNSKSVPGTSTGPPEPRSRSIPDRNRSLHGVK